MATTRKSKVETLVEQIAELSGDELDELGRRLAGLPPALRHRLEETAASEEPKHNILELRGLGKEFWRSIDVDAYLEEERNSWD